MADEKVNLDSSEKIRVFWSFDLETGGQPTDGAHSKVLALGRAWINPVTKELEKKRFVFSFTRDDITPSCWKYFWSKPENLLVLEALEKNVKTTFAAVYIDLAECDRIAKETTGDYTIPMCDMLSFDATLVTEEFRKLGKCPITHTYNGMFRPVIDVHSFVFAAKLRKDKNASFWEGKDGEDSIKHLLGVNYAGAHTHFPEDDAELNLNKFLCVAAL